ncbi:putativelike polyketide cyclase [Diaporthe ampelina]|uniref:Putativelike polyketide cyclase n=1 Tax=Diaporthe ampelina TaxID=1214573 RepID=A0A0G2G117_9PEZI|nr:putativelike polyketide cyclase [Diaporthe ampelina]
MASEAAINAVVLEVLDRHLRNEPHERTEITINKAKHEIVSSALDFLVKDTASPLLAARVILTVRDTSRSNGAGDQPTTELAAHITASTNPDTSSPSSISVILDDIHHAHGGPPPAAAAATPQRASAIPTHPGTGTSTKRPLAETYREYISTFMADPATAAASLPRFLHQPVTHNTRALSVPEYHGLGQVVRGSIPDLGCEVVGLIADEERQVVAARLEFAGTLVRPFAGAQPPAGGGRAVRIGEIVFYWFDGGRIREVVSLVDMKGLQAQS